MASREAKVIISAEDKTKAGIASATSAIQGFDKTAAKIGETIKKAFAVTALISFGKQVVDFGIDSVKAFGEAERAMAQLKTALGGNDAAFSRMNDFIAQMGTKTLASKDEVEALVAELASLGKSEADIKKLTEASVALSNVTGQSLDSAFKALNGTYVGTTKELKKLLPEIGDLTKEQLAAGGAVDLLNEKFGDISDSMGEGILQSTKNLSDAWGDLKEEIGQGWAEAFKPMTDAITAAVNHMASELARATASKKKVTDIVGLSGLVSSGDVAGATKMAQGMDKATLGDAYMQARDANPLATAKQQAALDAIRTILATMSAPGYKPVVTVSPDTPLVITPTGALDEAEWNRFVDDNRVGWRTLDSGIDDVVAGILNPPLPSGSASDRARAAGGGTPFSVPEPVSVSEGFDLYGGQQMSMSGMGLEEMASGLGEVIGPLVGTFSQLAEPVMMIMQILDPISLILKGFMDIIGPALTQTIEPLFNALQNVGALVAEALFPILDSLAPIFTILADIIMRAVVPLINLLAPAIEMIAGILDLVMTPILKAISVAFEVLMSPVKWLGELFAWVGLQMKIFIANLTNPIWERDQDHTAFSSDAFSGLEGRIANIWNANYKGSLVEGGVTLAAGGASASLGGASYSGSQAITFNFYNQGNVVGQGGLEELAAILQGILTRNARYA